MTEFNREKVEDGVKMIVEGIGDTLSRPDTEETPLRVAKMYGEILSGYHEDPKKFIKLFPSDATDMVVVRNVPIYSYCAHHMQPFFGKITIAYIPNGQVLGLSKLVRIARVFAKRLQLQENLTKEIAKCIEDNVPNNGVAVSIKAQHMCMVIRGVRSYGAETVTTYTSGKFKTDQSTKDEFMTHLSDKEGY